MTHTVKVAAAHIAPASMDKTAIAEKAAHWVDGMLIIRVM